MTVNDFIRKLDAVASMFTSGDIPVYYRGSEADLYLFVKQDEKGRYRVDLDIEESNETRP